jgi:hypothetical protein
VHDEFQQILGRRGRQFTHNQILALDDAQKLNLQVQWQLADFVQKDGALIGGLEFARAISDCAGVTSACLKAHQLVPSKKHNPDARVRTHTYRMCGIKWQLTTMYQQVRRI